jgi:DNA-binding winged helix-turn-helix (wHTH) protein/TolB-like protein
MSVEARQAPIDLAHEAPFSLGRLEIRPAKLEAVAGERREVLEPRIMQVLVALARQRGEVVSRDDLIGSCWGGRIVGDDSINRCIFRLRRLAADLGGFSLQTIPRVGYRLAETDAAAARGGSRRRAWIISASAMVILLAAVAGVWVWRRTLVVEARPPEPLSVAVAPFAALDSDPAEKTMAVKLTDQINGVLADSSIVSVLPSAARAAKADLLVRGTVTRAADGWRVRVYMEDRRADLVLWSKAFDGAAEPEAALRDRVAFRLTEALYYALQPRLQGGGLKVDPQTLSLWVTANDESRNGSPNGRGRPRELVEQVLKRAPDFAAPRAWLALTMPTSGNTPEETRALRARVIQEATRAMRYGTYGLGAGSDPLYGEARSDRPSDLAGAENILLKAINAGTEFPFVYVHECRFLVELGRASEALPHCERAMALRPLAGAMGWTYASALSSQGQLAQARQVADLALRYNPGNALARQIRFEIDAFKGSPDAARAVLHAPASQAQVGTPALIAALDELLDARKSPSRAAIDRVLRDLRASGSDRITLRYLIFAAATFGRTDEAFAALATPGLEVAYRSPAILLEPAVASLRGDPRFWAAAAKAGYVTYWRTRNRWPDFCSAPGNTIDCPRMAAQALAKG